MAKIAELLQKQRSLRALALKDFDTRGHAGRRSLHHVRSVHGWFKLDMVSVMASIDDRLNEIRYVRNDIWRYRRRLQSELSDLERKVLEERLLERQSAFERLLATTFPFTWTL